MAYMCMLDLTKDFINVKTVSACIHDAIKIVGNITCPSEVVPAMSCCGLDAS